MRQELTPVVILDLAYAGYGIVRSLSSYGIPVIGLFTERDLPEARTRLCLKKVRFQGESDLINKLHQLSEGLGTKPVLILTADDYVKFCLKHREFVEDRFLVQLPPDNVVELLMDKIEFSEYARRKDILVPRCLSLCCADDLDNISQKMKFPVVLKPHNRTPKWVNEKLPKAYLLSHIDDVKKIYHEIRLIEPRLLVQEWIPGQDSNIHYCLTYFAEKGQCLAAFTGYKIRQWAVRLGSTATTAPVDNRHVLQKTCEILKDLQYQGFGSIEFKQHEYDGRYYLIEPTVGRVNQQEYIATLNGTNLPLRCYCFLTGSNIDEELPPLKEIILIDEPAEIASAYVHMREKMISCAGYWKSIQGVRKYRYANRNDLHVFIGLCSKLIILFSKRFFGSIDAD
jgi:predicted ATP-grasp superfamily ATP-dependent carboligase